MERNDDEERLLRFVALENAKSILLARQRAEEELIRAKEALEQKTQELAHSLAMMRQAEERLRFVLDSMPQKIFTAKPNGDVDYFNPQWTEFTGLPFEEIRDWGWTRFIHLDDVEKNVRVWQTSIDTGEPFQFEHRFRRADGAYRWHISRAMALKDAEGKVLMWVGSNTDIHDVKQAEQKTKFLADASAELAELTDPESTLQKLAAIAVPAFADWCEVDLIVDEVGLRRLVTRHTEPDKVRVAQALVERYPPRSDDLHGLGRVIRTGEPELVEDIPDALLSEVAHDAEHLRILRELGMKSYICVPMLSRGRTLGVLSFVTAESARRFDAADLTVALELVRRAAVAIENANLYRALRDADRRKNEFLAMLAHELRNPLAPIRNALEILRVTGGNGEAVASASETMERQVGQMVRLVDDLLDVNRISRGKIELRRGRIELASVMNHAVEAIRPLCKSMNHELTVTLPPQPVYLNADPTRLAQIVGNVLNNACKFTDKGGRIWLTVEREPPRSPPSQGGAGGVAVIRIRDNGIGIAADQLPRIFDMFTQIDTSLERSVGGLGIGLMLVKNLVEMHGGTVEVHSAGIGQGTELLVRLPILVETPEPPPEPTVSEPTSTTARRILVVDDNHDSAESLAMLLKITGNETHTAYEGLEAVQAAATFRPDVVLLDIGLPKLNGFDACRRIREQPWGEDMVLVALTGWGQEEDRRRTEEAGFDAHMVKPVDYAALMKLLAELQPTPASRPC